MHGFMSCKGVNSCFPLLQFSLPENQPVKPPDFVDVFENRCSKVIFSFGTNLRDLPNIPENKLSSFDLSCGI